MVLTGKEKGARLDIVNNMGNTPLMQCFLPAMSQIEALDNDMYKCSNGYEISLYPIWF